MRFVPVKSVCSKICSQCSTKVNQVGGLLAEYGITVSQGLGFLVL
jgi:hypothetical protein